MDLMAKPIYLHPRLVMGEAATLLPEGGMVVSGNTVQYPRGETGLALLLCPKQSDQSFGEDTLISQMRGAEDQSAARR